MQLNKENYHSIEANKQYMSVSQFKSFLLQYNGCEAKTMAKLNREWEDGDNPAFLLGSYVHAWNEGVLPEFIANNPGLFKKDGTLYAKYAIGDEMINTLKNDEVAMAALEGQKEVIITEELFGMPFKIMIDSYNPEKEAFTDLKTCREINKTYWNELTRERENFIIHWGYDVQVAVYSEIELRYRKGKDYYMPHILAVSKEDPPDKELIMFGRNFIPDLLDQLEVFAPRVYEVWQGKAEPRRCGTCDYCRSTKKLKEAIYYIEVGL